MQLSMQFRFSTMITRKCKICSCHVLHIEFDFGQPAKRPLTYCDCEFPFHEKKIKNKSTTLRISISFLGVFIVM